MYKLPDGAIVAVYDDVTSRKHAEEQLLRKTEEWEKTFDAIPEEENHSPLPTGNESILFIDDEPAIVNSSRSILTSLGYKVTAETKSTKALEKFQASAEAFDLVITDQTMPDITGVELAQAMLQQRLDLPIILCTGYTSAFSEDEVYALGIKSFVIKPLKT